MPTRLPSESLMIARAPTPKSKTAAEIRTKRKERKGWIENENINEVPLQTIVR